MCTNVKGTSENKNYCVENKKRACQKLIGYNYVNYNQIMVYALSLSAREMHITITPPHVT